MLYALKRSTTVLFRGYKLLFSNQCVGFEKPDYSLRLPLFISRPRRYTFQTQNAVTLMYACHIEFNNANVFIGVEQTRCISQRHNAEKDTLRFNYDFSVLFTEEKESQLLKC